LTERQRENRLLEMLHDLAPCLRVRSKVYCVNVTGLLRTGRRFDPLSPRAGRGLG